MASGSDAAAIAQELTAVRQPLAMIVSAGRRWSDPGSWRKPVCPDIRAIGTDRMNRCRSVACSLPAKMVNGDFMMSKVWQGGPLHLVQGVVGMYDELLRPGCHAA